MLRLGGISRRSMTISCSLSKGYEHEYTITQTNNPLGNMGFGGKALGRKTKFLPKMRSSFFNVTLMSQAGTGSTMSWIRGDKDPKAVVIAEDVNLPDSYQGDERKVVWIEVEKGNRVFPGSRYTQKKRRDTGLGNPDHGWKPQRPEGENWHRQLNGATKVAAKPPKFNQSKPVFKHPEEEFAAESDFEDWAKRGITIKSQSEIDQMRAKFEENQKHQKFPIYKS